MILTGLKNPKIKNVRFPIRALFVQRVLFLVFTFCILFPPFTCAEETGGKSFETSNFNRAEFLFHAGEFVKAKQAYQEYFQKKPGFLHADQALFRLGQIDFRNGFHTTALRYFNLLLENFPNTPLVYQARFLMAVCHFEMEHFDDAEEIFRNQLKTNPDTGKRWESLLYLGKLDEKRFDYTDAIAKIRQVYVRGADQELRNHAARAAEKIVNEKLPRETLLALAQKFRSGFPGDLIRLRLIALYRLERNNEDYQTVLREFLDFFPTHPRRSEVEKMWLQVKGMETQSLRLAAVLPLTGERALAGQQVLQGIQLAFNQLSVQERENLELIVKDSGSGQPLLETVEELATDPNVIGIIGPVLSGHVKEIAPLAQKYQIPVFSPTASSPGLTSLNPYIFRNALTRKIQGKFLAEYAVNELELRRFVILYPEESYGEELKDIFMEETKALGAEIVTAVPYRRSQNDFKAQILEIGGIPDNDLKEMAIKQLSETQDTREYPGGTPFSRPLIEQGLLNEDTFEDLKVSLELNYDAIFIPGFHDKVELIAPQLNFYNIDQVTLLGTNSWNNPNLVKNAGQYLRNKGIFVDGFFIHSKEEQVKTFVKDFKTTFNEEPTILSAQAFDTTRIFLKLIREGAGNRQQLKTRLHSIKDYPGVSGNTTILPSGDSGKKLFVLKIRGRKIIQVN